MNLGNGTNTSANEADPALLEDDATGGVTLYFASNRPGGAGLEDIYASVQGPDGRFGPATLVAELSTPSNDKHPAIRRDGLELFMTSDRPGGLGSADVWVSTRTSAAAPWSTPVNLGPVVNTPTRLPDLEQANDFRPALSFDGTTLYFAAAFRPGNVSDMFDVWVTTRTKVGGPD